MKYKSFELDPFQIDSIKAIDNNYSVVVSAATGTGKTLIADYVVNQAIKAGKQVIYTSPIKALSNQKYREFSEAFGDKVGLLTGDVVINGSAPILIMTTEIYRNMLLEKKEPFPNLSYVVFDEIHYINDIERGTVWEESLIFSPSHVRFLCLSATIPNYRDFADWIQEIKGHKVETINFMKRAVPLKHELFDYKLGLCDSKDLKKDLEGDNQRDYYKVMGYKKGRTYKTENDHGRHGNHSSRGGRGGRGGFGARGGSFRKKTRLPDPDYINLVKQLRDAESLPGIFFTFSRKDAFSKAKDMGKKFIFTTNEEKAEIITYLRQNIPDSIRDMDSVKDMRRFLEKGFGVHHAGILPKMKEIVENLFARGLIKVLFATETFAVGNNMPAKTVVTSSLKKYDGISVRYLTTKEYFQMAGRAGRRGIDKFGRVIVLINRNDLDINELIRVTLKDVEPIISRFNVSYNTALNLVKNYKKPEREVILKSNFGFFMRKQGQAQNRIDQSYINYLRILTKMGYLTINPDSEDHEITWKGEFATHIYSHDLVIPELYYSKIMQNLTEEELILVLTALEYEPRLADKFKPHGIKVNDLIKKISEDAYVLKRVKKKSLKTLAGFIKIWTKGGEFGETLESCNLAEGDVIRLFRRVLDNLRQIRAALKGTESDEKMIQKIEKCMDLVDRDIVSVEF